MDDIPESLREPSETAHMYEPAHSSSELVMTYDCGHRRRNRGAPGARAPPGIWKGGHRGALNHRALLYAKLGPGLH